MKGFQVINVYVLSCDLLYQHYHMCHQSSYYTTIHHIEQLYNQEKEAVYIISHPNTPKPQSSSHYRHLVPALAVFAVAAGTACPRIIGAATGLLAAALQLKTKGVLIASAGLAFLTAALTVLGDGPSGSGSRGRRGGARGRGSGLDRGSGFDRGGESGSVVGSGRGGGVVGGRGGDFVVTS